MSEHGILFSAPMVRAILDGRKTQTRRVVNPMHMSVTGEILRWPYGDRGDRLWVRETWQLARADRNSEGVVDDEVIWSAPIPTTDPRGKRLFDDWCLGYAADGGEGPWRPSIFMPRWASRISLKVTSARIEHLQDINEGDAEREGVDGPSCSDEAYGWFPSGAFRELWDSINGKRPGCTWADNPWVWVLTFEREPTP